MIKWNKKTYARELKKGYWGLEPHFNYYSLLKTLSLLETFVKNKMTIKNIKSAMYGEFVCEGKPIKKGFYEHMNMCSEIVDAIIKKNQKLVQNDNKSSKMQKL